MKNIKKLRKMSTKKFAKWLNEISQACFGCDGCPHCVYDKECNGETIIKLSCEKGMYLWLKKEAKK